MINPMMTAIPVAAGVFMVACGAVAAPRGKAPNTSVEVGVQEAPIVMSRDFTLADLKAMSAQLRTSPAHPVLGFYAGTVGYALQSIEVLDAQSATRPACPGFRLAANIVVTDRRIEIANDLAGPPCQLKAAVEHYQHHAAAASTALHRFASELPAKLGPEIEQRIRLQPGTPQQLRNYIDALLSDAIDSFVASLSQVQQDVDTESETRQLSTPCDET